MKKISALLAIAMLALSCGDSGDEGGGGNPSAAALIAPINNSECLTGTPVSSTQSSVTFEWNPSENTDNYFIYIKNLATGTTSQFNAGTSLTYQATLQKGVPYSWYVSSRKEGRTSVSSPVWKFYNAADSVTNYAPFPAEAVYPEMSATHAGATIDLQWSADDLENDIETYKVYFGTNQNPTTLTATVTQPQLLNVAVVSGSTYYWKVVTTDVHGNASLSQTFQFRVQ